MSNISTENNTVEYTIDWLLGQIASIQAETGYINHIIEKLLAMPDGDSGKPGSPGNIQGQAKAEALGNIVKYRETTNQQLLSFYNKMYDDLAGRSPKEIFEAVRTM